MLMECNKEEAVRARAIAESRMQNKDFLGAKKFAIKAQQLFPELENVSHMLTVCEVHCSAGSKVNGEMDWYGILQVEPTADDASIKKQYRKLALLLHPDKNKFAGAEAAFKLIGEANMTLSDRGKRSLHDIKRRANISVQARQPQQQSSRTSYVRKQSAFPDNGRNSNGLNQQQSAFSSVQAFWTTCSHCGMRYQYYRNILNRALRCQSCLKPFIAIDIDAQGVPPAAKSGAPNIRSGIPQQEVSGQHAHGAGQQTYSRNASTMGFQGNVVGGPATAEPWAKSRINADKGVFTNNGKGDNKVNEEVESGNELKFEKVNLQEVNKKEQTVKPSAGNANRKRGKRMLVECSDSDSSTDSEDVVMEDIDAVPSESRHPRRSSRQKQNVTYNEGESDGDEDGDNFVASLSSKRLRKGGTFGDGDLCDKAFSKEEGNGIHVWASGIADAEQKNGKEKPYVPFVDSVSNGNEAFGTFVHLGDKQGVSEDDEMVKAGSGSTADSSSPDNLNTFSYPDPEFCDFDKNRDQSLFAADQVWAIYDNSDGMPRFYARIKNVSTSGFKLRFTWLEHEPSGEAEVAWSDEGLPVACGNFRFGKSEWAEDRLMFSHVMAWRKGPRRNLYEIYPMKGDVWALFKNWDISWSCDPDNGRVYQYEVVEVLSDYEKGSDARVAPLVKIKGFVALFMRDTDKGSGLLKIPSSEMLRFSHQVPCYRLTGNEREGIPEGCFELDSASLPSKFDETFPSISLDSATARFKSFQYTVEERFASGAAEKSTQSKEKNPGKKVMSREEPADLATRVSVKGLNQASSSENAAAETWNHAHIEGEKQKHLDDDEEHIDCCNISSDSAAQHHGSSSLRSSSPVCYEYPESEFHNFEQERSSDNFHAGQIWALFSDVDKFPNYYGYIKKVEQKEFRVDMAWLEPCRSQEDEIQWIGEDLPVACGGFKVTGDVVSYDTTETFSHVVQVKQTGKRTYDIYPVVGELWAVYKSWHVGWKYADLKNADYDVVEVISYSGAGIRVQILEKVDGYSAVFMPVRNGSVVTRMDIPTDQLLRFSHRIPAFKLSEERGGKLRGYWELDPASVPEVLLFAND